MTRRRFPFVLACVGALLLLGSGAALASRQFMRAQHLGLQVDATSTILLASLGLQRALVEDIHPSRYLVAEVHQAAEDMQRAVTVLQELSTALVGDVRWMQRHIEALADTRQRYYAASSRPRRDFMRAQLSLQLSELTDTAETLHRSAVRLRTESLTALFLLVAGLLAVVGLGIVLLLLQYLRNQRLRDRHEESLRRAHVQLQAYAEELEQYLYVASHDLKEPLRSISLYVELLQTDLLAQCGEPEVHRYLTTVRRNADRMKILLDRLLELAILDRKQPQPEHFSAQAEAEEVAAIFAARLAELGGSLEIGELPSIRVDRLRFSLVLQNLIGNAINYHVDDRPLHIVLSAERLKAAWRLSVRDNGRGIDPQHHEEIFKLFKRLHPETSGSGAGLTLCRKSVEQWGGRIWVESQPGHGATFSFTIPDSVESDLRPPGEPAQYAHR